MLNQESEYFLRDLEAFNEVLEAARIANSPEAAQELLDLEAMPRGRDANSGLLLRRLLRCYVGCDASLEEVVGPGARARGLRSLLHVAASEGYLGIARFLLEWGAEPSDQDELRRSGLHMAAARGHRQVALLLLEDGADPRALHCSGKTALHFAAEAEADDDELVRVLLDRGLGVNDADRIHGNTPLHLAVWSSRHRVAKVLLERGADTGLKNANGSTPIHLAVKTDRILELFLERGVDFRLTDARGFTPLLCLNNTNKFMEASRIIARLVLEEAVFGIPPGKENDNFMQIESLLRQVRNGCFEEIARMRQLRCYKKMTAFDLLGMSVSELAGRIKNRRLSHALARVNYESEFEHYGIEIRTKLLKAHLAKAHAHRVSHFLYRSLDGRLPFVVTEMIGKYLEPEDIKFS